MKVAERMKTALTEALAPAELEIIDQSHLHAGHAGAPEGGESHFRVRIVSAAFTGKSRVERQRQVNSILAELLAGPVHALSMDLQAPEA
ncbi:BolA family transcriptional regulator [Parvularcula sp. IMCC14364]|uniref:BolA family protein n=1 Tax=Parvularcula sp. IMCC14364 TaxID=3067902 RepID=UPI002741B071|nr:BolA family protein [Parvularcula sp. IMCC14364]